MDVASDPPGSLSHQLGLHWQVLGLAPQERYQEIEGALVVGCLQTQPTVPPLKTKH
ncbi:hypothetical protein DPMN_172219 [Dreissena polymorpha]|uniref:Uncharacterized protein n=1 Tax=Dreissena polymorpha TaxID=45954 RepID=A0A9D4E1W5_DREPO|nr:hypothetical protein DPMN_172219 [Dreissena polymorpha]